MPTIVLLNNSTQKALTTLFRMKLFLNLEGTDKQDQRLTMLINFVTGFIERQCRRSFLRQTYTAEVYDGNGHNALILRQFPVASVSSLQYRNSNDPNDDSWTSFDAADYAWYSDGRVKNLVGTFTDIPQKYRATYAAGYLIDFDNENTPASHTLPPDVEYVCQKLVAAIFNTRRAEGYDDTSIGDQSVTLRKLVMSDPEVRAILDKYAAPVF